MWRCKQCKTQFSARSSVCHSCQATGAMLMEEVSDDPVVDVLTWKCACGTEITEVGHEVMCMGNVCSKCRGLELDVTGFIRDTRDALTSALGLVDTTKGIEPSTKDILEDLLARAERLNMELNAYD